MLPLPLMFASLSGVLSIACICILAACAVVAVVGTRIVRSKQKRQVRRWRIERKCCERQDKD